MRFDLPRISHEQLSMHLLNIAKKESVTLEKQAAQLIAYSAEGSVRDALSLLDQAVGNAGNGNAVSLNIIQNMLGVSDKNALFGLLANIINGDITTVLSDLTSLYKAGADPIVTLQDLLEMTHIATVGHVHHGELPYDHLSDSEKTSYRMLIEKSGIPFLTRLWQMLLKGLEEAKNAPTPLTAVEMILIRTTYASDLPTPHDFIKSYDNEPPKKKHLTQNSATIDGPNSSGTDISPPLSTNSSEPAPSFMTKKAPVVVTTTHAQLATQADISLDDDTDTALSFADLITYCHTQQEHLIAAHLQEISLTLFDVKEARLEFCPAAHSPANLSGQLNQLLHQWTDKRWMVSISNEVGLPSLNAQAETAKQEAINTAHHDVLVRETLNYFPDSTITHTHPPEEGVNHELTKK